MFKSKLPQHEQGFTLVEVLIAILITTIFISIAMQAMVIAAVFKVRARQVAEATTWIQEDLENVRFQAGKLRYTQLTNNPIIGATSLSLSSVTGFAVGDTLRVGTDTTNYTISVIDQNAKTITINSPGLSQAASSGATVVATNPCKASSSTAGFGESLNLNQPAAPSETNNSANPNSGTKTITGKSYTLTRTVNVGGTDAVSGTCTSNACYELLKLAYEVKQGSEAPIATMYTEVIPNAAMQCPQ
ncbi:MAG TPA: hypothetical protein DEV81_23060 [Cyanobacteria bacterium UBA11049]|nr:hypothetical protein [Cyanobacteria bacterium UBA11049]